jgi:hypothetical protein
MKIERIVILQVLIQTKNKTILKGFVTNGGLQAIHDWLENLVERRLAIDKEMSRLEGQILQRILIVL